VGRQVAGMVDSKQPVFVEVREAAIALFGRYTPGTRDRVYRFIDNGIIKAVKDGRKYYIPRVEIERYEQKERG